MTDIIKLTTAEEEIMQILWQAHPVTVHQIIETIPNAKLAYNTISTIVRILENKSYVAYQKKGKSHLYYPLISKEDYKKQTVNKLLNNYFDGSINHLVSFFAKENQINLNELDDLLKKIKH